ncbi:hypothetical protein L1987_48983 [Smallanthus sonchifolius]|uniref:Uncharacterized protein n=1 Tax=Smallanthus sonchifolius TaxID=185202 RepID=A0ACB9FSU0_9ASTR|nr:hypothetical protein L1987_48983 [Smallanthus sonchifolius]
MFQMKSSHLDPSKDIPRTTQNSSSSKLSSQLWLQYGSCPSGTIPIRRSSYNHQTNIYPRKVIFNADHSFAVAQIQGSIYSGARALMKVWQPYVESYDDYSSSQVMLSDGPLQSFETVKAGWTVNPIVYNDTKTRLFVYWSIDGMKNTGCFDFNCPGFVQTSTEVVIGGDIGTHNIGSEIIIQISKDPETNNWWFKYNEKQVGYWPGDIFQLMKVGATMVQWGGEVYSPYLGTAWHTETAMGNGKFSDLIFRNSGTMSGMLIEERFICTKATGKAFH